MIRSSGLLYTDKQGKEGAINLRNKKAEKPEFLKIVYFDEDAAQDYVDVTNGDRKSTRLNSSHNNQSRMPSSA